MCECVCESVCVDVWVRERMRVCVYGFRCQKKALDPLELELQVNCELSDGSTEDQTQVSGPL